MNTIIILLKSILMLSNIYSFIFNVLIPFYFISNKKYKIRLLFNKNIKANVNHKTKTTYIHLMATINSLIIFIVLSYDLHYLKS